MVNPKSAFPLSDLILFVASTSISIILISYFCKRSLFSNLFHASCICMQYPQLGLYILINAGPDLIILSLGTNEVSDNKSYIEEDIGLFIDKLYQSTQRQFSVLLTTPLDYKRKSALAFNLSNQILNQL